MRAEAIQAISTWPNPSVLDRVDGRYRGAIERDPAMVRSRATTAITQLLSNKDSATRISAVKAIGVLGMKESSGQLLTMLKTDREADVRVEALTTLVSLEDAQVAEAVKAAIADKEKKVRVAGLNLLQKMNISKDLMVSLLSQVINTKTVEEKQAALLTLGKLPVENSRKVLEDLLNRMEGGKLAPDLYLEMGEAIDSTRSSELIARYKNISGKLSPDELTAAYAGSLSGGDVDRGRNILFRNQNAQCMKCHAYDDRGGNAGPRLNGVAARLTRPQLLEALISPSARLAPGFGFVTVDLKNGKKVSGTLQAENNSSITLKSGDQPGEVIQKNQIANRQSSPSSMPDMKSILSKKEIRDVVSFLATLKEDN
jgi:putative heme-binding domain-containing protein